MDQRSFEKSEAPEQGWAASCARVAVEECMEEEIQLEEMQLPEKLPARIIVLNIQKFGFRTDTECCLAVPV